MKTVCKKLLCLMLVAMLLVSAVPAAFAAEGTPDLVVSLWIDGNLEKSEVNPTQQGYPVDYSWPDDSFKGYVSQNWSEYPDEADIASVAVERLAASGTDGNRVRVKVTLKAADNGGTTGGATGGTTGGTGGECSHATTTKTNSATCTAGGYEIERCQDCGARVSTREVGALGHDLDDDGECQRSGCDYAEEPAPAATGKLIISVYKEDGNNRTWIKDVEKPAGTYTLNDALAAEVYSGQKIKYSWGSRTGNTVTVTNSDVNVTLSIIPLETENGRGVYQLRVQYNNGTSDYKQIDIYEGEGILAAIKNAGIKPTYKDHVLVGYINNHTGNSKTYLTIYDVADADDADSTGVIKVYADWRDKTDDDDDEDFEYGEGGGLYGEDNDDPIYDVVLRIYTNGNTKNYAKKVSASSMGKYTKDGKLTRDEVQLVVEKYFKTYDDTKYYGLFTTKTWDDGDYDTDDAVYTITLDPDETTNVYVMVKNAKAYVADSSNPKTGDDIMIAVTTMGLAAAALVSIMELKKRKMI